ncbi:MAG: hypothetical protein HOB52_01305 [Euryarchaeota archaeon]|jgi:hypothetical protein|nr:hypothetical protein [Euryarchaeota archaeon]MBT4408148.1 hypothetical protein [Euryarchaeota archaeon]MBT6644425.1 hypothetical protein [Euryarchaeota archaeon]
MVEIQCPHCDEDIELDDGASGLFDCPHCDEEFSWEDDTDEVHVLYLFKQWWNIFVNGGMKGGLGIIGFGIIVFMWYSITEGPAEGPYDGIWILIPFGIWIVGVSVVIISFLLRLWKIRTFMKNE